MGRPGGIGFTHGPQEWRDQQMRSAAVNAGVAATMMLVGTGQISPSTSGRHTRVMVDFYYGYIKTGTWPTESTLGVPRDMDGLLD